MLLLLLLLLLLTDRIGSVGGAGQGLHQLLWTAALWHRQRAHTQVGTWQCMITACMTGMLSASLLQLRKSRGC
jgi:hypothetical protein